MSASLRVTFWVIHREIRSVYGDVQKILPPQGAKRALLILLRALYIYPTLETLALELFQESV